MMAAMSPRHLALLVLGVVAVSFAAVLIRAADAPALAVALYRNGIAAAILLPLALARHRAEFRALSRRQVGMALLAGALLAAHFATWIPSLSMTTVGASTVLVTTQPVWVALAGHLWLGDRVSGRALAGIAVAFAGAAVVSGGDFGISGRALLGDGLALLGAVTAAGYYLAGRSLRRSVSLLTYVGIAYTTCTLLLFPAMLVSGTPFGGFEAKTWWAFVGLALVPQIMGHTVFNYLLRFVDATVVAVAIMGEPVGASLLALAIFGEVPPWSAVGGGVLILAGIFVAITAQAGRRASMPLEEVPVE
jgi:drug/metabolite transporter (DMT)-like permease